MRNQTIVIARLDRAIQDHRLREPLKPLDPPVKPEDDTVELRSAVKPEDDKMGLSFGCSR